MNKTDAFFVILKLYIKFIFMLTQMLENILVAQIEKEAYSSNLYLAMASWAENKRPLQNETLKNKL